MNGLRDEIIAILAPNARDWSARKRDAQRRADAILADLNGRNSHAADELARVKAVLASEEAVKVLRLALSRSGLDDVMAEDATAALAALCELIGGV